MPSLAHEIPIELIRDRPEIVRELLHVVEVELPSGVIEPISAELTQVAPAEYRADLALAICDAAHERTFGVVVEVQRNCDEDKPFVWPLYVMALRARLRRPVVLLVLATTEGVARWARRTIESGHPGCVLEPIVISFDMVPRVTDREVASRAPELAILSAIAHVGDRAVGQTAVESLKVLPEDKRALYWDVIEGTHPDVARLFLEEYMKGYQYQSEFARKYFAQGEEKGLEQGREEGREDLVVEIARSKLASMSADDERRIRRLNAAMLVELALALGRAENTVDARAILDRLTPAGSRDADD